MDKLSYSMGIMIAQNLTQMNVSKLDFKDFAAGVEDSMPGKEPAVSFEEASQLLNDFFAKAEAAKMFFYFLNSLEIG